MHLGMCPTWLSIKILYIQVAISEQSANHHNRLENHLNTLFHPLLEPQNERRLKRNWPADITNGWRGPVIAEDPIVPNKSKPLLSFAYVYWNIIFYDFFTIISIWKSLFFYINLVDCLDWTITIIIIVALFH